MSQLEQVIARIEHEQEEYLEELKEYLSIPSISTDSEYKDDVHRCADWLESAMAAAGLEAEQIQTDGYPLVYGEWSGAEGAPTLLFYGHYDVQPPDPLEEWRHPPFEPTIEGGRIVARGATDDKGQSFAQLMGVGATLAECGELPVNVKFLHEGEEESGGESIEAFVRADGGQRLACDAVVVCDTSMYGSGQPALLYGLKGMAYMELEVHGPNRDLHSGTFGGGVANPANALATILASLRDPKSGKVQIEGFYEAVLPLEEAERQEFAALEFDEAALAAELGVPALTPEEGYTYIEQVWARPTCDVNGLWGGYQGTGAKTVLPAKAGAKVSMRLVPEQDSKEIAELFRRHVEHHTPPGVEVEVRYVHGAPAVRLPLGGPLMEAAMAAQEAVWGERPVLIREGGSIPIVGTFAEELEVPVLLVGLGLPDDRLHSPNEKFDLLNFYNGIQTIAHLLDQVAKGDAGSAA